MRTQDYYDVVAERLEKSVSHLDSEIDKIAAFQAGYEFYEKSLWVSSTAAMTTDWGTKALGKFLKPSLLVVGLVVGFILEAKRHEKVYEQHRLLNDPRRLPVLKAYYDAEAARKAFEIDSTKANEEAYAQAMLDLGWQVSKYDIDNHLEGVFNQYDNGPIDYYDDVWHGGVPNQGYAGGGSSGGSGGGSSIWLDEVYQHLVA